MENITDEEIQAIYLDIFGKPLTLPAGFSLAIESCVVAISTKKEFSLTLQNVEINGKYTVTTLTLDINADGIDFKVPIL